MKRRRKTGISRKDNSKNVLLLKRFKKLMPLDKSIITRQV